MLLSLYLKNFSFLQAEFNHNIHYLQFVYENLTQECVSFHRQQCGIGWCVLITLRRTVKYVLLAIQLQFQEELDILFCCRQLVRAMWELHGRIHVRHPSNRTPVSTVTRPVPFKKVINEKDSTDPPISCRGRVNYSAQRKKRLDHLVMSPTSLLPCRETSHCYARSVAFTFNDAFGMNWLAYLLK